MTDRAAVRATMRQALADAGARPGQGDERGASEPGGAAPVLLALDFDGTLAPLRDDPTASRMFPEAARALRDLCAHPHRVRLALVSGRALASLVEVADPPAGTVLIGSHGSERAAVTPHGLDRDVAQLSDDQSDRLSTLGARMQAVARGRDGVWVETKPAAVVLHTRLAEPTLAAQAETEALAVGGELGSKVLHGKDVVEVSVLDADKGLALRALRDELSPRVVFYAGDDVTDENGFAALGPEDVTVKVGDGQTRARFRVSDPRELTDLLVDIAADVVALDD